MFDILCRQKEMPKEDQRASQKHSKHRQAKHRNQAKGLDFEFEVEDFYCLGSPIGTYP